jgi:hypothetical protein
MPRRTTLRHFDSDLILAIGRVEGKMDQIIIRFDEVKSVQTQHDDRLDALEHAQTRLKTLAAVIALGVSGVTPIVLKYFNLT